MNIVCMMPVSDNTHVSVLDNATTAQYSHTLNVTGKGLPAVYGCFVSNNKPSSAKAIATIDYNGINPLYIYTLLLPMNCPL